MTVYYDPVLQYFHLQERLSPKNEDLCIEVQDKSSVVSTDSIFGQIFLRNEMVDSYSYSSTGLTDFAHKLVLPLEKLLDSFQDDAMMLSHDGGLYMSKQGFIISYVVQDEYHKMGSVKIECLSTSLHLIDNMNAVYGLLKNLNTYMKS